MITNSKHYWKAVALLSALFCTTFFQTAQAQSITGVTVTGGVARTCEANEFTVTIDDNGLNNGTLQIDFDPNAMFSLTAPAGLTVNNTAAGQVTVDGLQDNGIAAPLQIVYTLQFPCDMISPQQNQQGDYIEFEETNTFTLTSGGVASAPFDFDRV